MQSPLSLTGVRNNCPSYTTVSLRDDVFQETALEVEKATI